MNATDNHTLRTLAIDNSALFIESGMTSALAVVKTRTV